MYICMGAFYGSLLVKVESLESCLNLYLSKVLGE